MDTEIKLIRNGDTPLEDSDPQEISIPKRPEPPEPESADSKITNVDPTMEYRPSDSDDKDYTTVENATETNVVTPGDYVVSRRADNAPPQQQKINSDAHTRPDSHTR